MGFDANAAQRLEGKGGEGREKAKKHLRERRDRIHKRVAPQFRLWVYAKYISTYALPNIVHIFGMVFVFVYKAV